MNFQGLEIFQDERMGARDDVYHIIEYVVQDYFYELKKH